MVVTPQVRAELLAHAPQGVPVGQPEAAAQKQPVWVGLQLTHKPEWHTYWKNSGDSGLPTMLEWTLPPGVMAGDIAWPLPKKIPIGNLANYGYEDTVLLPVPLTITPGFKPPPGGSTLDVKLKASWLVCRKECIPEEGEFAIQIPLQGSTALHAQAFEAAFKAFPQPVLVTRGVLPDSQARIDGNTLRLSVQGDTDALVDHGDLDGVVDRLGRDQHRGARRHRDRPVDRRDRDMAGHRSLLRAGRRRP